MQGSMDMSNFNGALTIKIRSCDDVLKQPKVLLTYQGATIESRQDGAIEQDELVPGVFTLNFKERGDTSESVKIELYDGDVLLGQC